MTFKSEIKQWNGKSADDILEIYNHHCEQKNFANQTIKFIEDNQLQKGATWLLKRHLENKSQLNQAQISKIFSQLNNLETWESKLHILQSLQYLLIPKLEKDKLETFLRNCLMETNKFVKAWTYDGFYQLAKQYPEHIKETKQFFEMAMRDEPPSVISRIRNIMKKGF